GADGGGLPGAGRCAGPGLRRHDAFHVHDGRRRDPAPAEAGRKPCDACAARPGPARRRNGRGNRRRLAGVLIHATSAPTGAGPTLSGAFARQHARTRRSLPLPAAADPGGDSTPGANGRYPTGRTLAAWTMPVADQTSHLLDDEELSPFALR